MKKRLNLDVDKLINRPARKKRTESFKLPPQKPINFQQMYNHAKKTFNQHPHNDPQKSLYYHSQNSSVNLISESLKASRITPQNSSRNHHHLEAATYQKLNKSLQTKSQSIEQKRQIVRSASSQFKIMNNPPKSSNNLSINRGPKNAQQKACVKSTEGGQGEWQGIQAFKKQWTECLKEMNHSNHEHLRGSQCFLNIEQTFQILKGLHYMRKTEDQKYLVKIWKQLDGQTYGGIPSNNLYQFLTFVNHTNNSYFIQNIKCNQNNIKIDTNLRLVASEAAKIQVYEHYLALRVNKILYGSNQQNNHQEKSICRNNNIKILQQQPCEKKKIIMLPKKTAFQKKSANQVPAHRAPKVMRILGRQKAQAPKQMEQHLQKDVSQETICYSQFSETRQSGIMLTSNSSQNSLQGPECIQEVVLRKPLFSVDVNIGQGVSQKIVVYEGQTARQVSKRLIEKYKMDDEMRNQFEQLLGVHIRNLLFRIQEVSQDFFSDRQE